MSPRYLFPNPGRLTVSIVDWAALSWKKMGNRFHCQRPPHDSLSSLSRRERKNSRSFSSLRQSSTVQLFPPGWMSEAPFCGKSRKVAKLAPGCLRDANRTSFSSSSFAFANCLSSQIILQEFARSSLRQGEGTVRFLVDKMIQCSPCAITLSFGTSSMLRMLRMPSIPLS